MSKTFRCFFVEKNSAGEVSASLTRRAISELPEADTLVRVRYSSLNYKDALAATGNPGVARRLPHVPGVDAAGVIESSTAANLPVGKEVIVTGYELGAGCWGGWSEYIRVPAAWIVEPPPGLSLLEAMMLGTAGFTAAQCVASLQHHQITPDSGEVVVTGATGGVGVMAVQILAQLGYQVVAATGKPQAAEKLRQLGATRVVAREEVNDLGERPLLSARWAGGVDTVGGTTLATLLRSTKHRGCIAACGLVGGADLSLTVYPFLLRGIKLDGIDSAQCPLPTRLQIWKLLAGPWKPRHLSDITTFIPLADVDVAVKKILRGDVFGRIVIQCDTPPKG